MATTIPTVPEATHTPPNRGQSQDDFNNNMSAAFVFEHDLPTNMNAAIDPMNTLGQETEDNAAAAADSAVEAVDAAAAAVHARNNAALSSTAAAESATAAANSETAASQSESSASQSATSAEQSATSASQDATSTEQDALSASQDAASASQSATSASQDAAAASQDALSASLSASAASQDALSASQSADAASNVQVGSGIGRYEDNLTLTDYSEYVTYGVSPTLSHWKVKIDTALPYTINSSAYPNPSDDPNLSIFSWVSPLLTTPSLADRTPTRGDNKDFAGSQVWRAPDGLYESNRVSAGNWATWHKDRLFYPPAGDVVGQPAAIWWLSKARIDYSGACINVTNEALGTSQDIGFSADGTLDTDELDGFLRASRGLVNTWYDQSGNGHDLTSSGVNRPVISSVSKVGNMRGIVFENPVVYNGQSEPDQFMTIPASLSGDSNNVSFASLCSLANSKKDAPIIELSGNDGNFTALGKREQTGADGMAVYQNSSLRINTENQPAIKDNVFIASIGASAIEYVGNDTFSKSGTSTTAVPWVGGKVGGTTNLFIGGDALPNNGGTIMAGLIVYNKAISVVEARNIFKSITKHHETTPQNRGNIVFDGDSITEGAFATFFDSYPSVVAESLSTGARVYQVAKSGGTSVTQGDAVSRWDASIYRPTAPYNLVVYAVGTNDIGVGSDATTIYNNILSYVSDVVTAGYDVILCSVLPRSYFIGNQEEVERLALNQLLRDNWGSIGCVGFVDYEDEGTMGNTAFVDNVAYYADGTHPTPLGYALMSVFVRDTLEPVIAQKLQGF